MDDGNWLCKEGPGGVGEAWQCSEEKEQCVKVREGENVVSFRTGSFQNGQ